MLLFNMQVTEKISLDVRIESSLFTTCEREAKNRTLLQLNDKSWIPDFSYRI